MDLLGSVGVASFVGELTGGADGLGAEPLPSSVAVRRYATNPPIPRMTATSIMMTTMISPARSLRGGPPYCGAAQFPPCGWYGCDCQPGF
jgi:hypothetical protein